MSESDSDSYYSSEAELADASAQTEAAVQSADAQTCAAVSDGAAQAGTPWSQLTEYGAQTESATTVSAEAQTSVVLADCWAQADVVAVAAAEVQTFMDVSESGAQYDRIEVAAAEVQTFVASTESEAQADMIEAESAAEMSVHTLKDPRESSDLREWESWWEKALSLPPPPECLPFDLLGEAELHKEDKENRWKLPPIHATSPTKSDAPAWLKATLISEWDVSPRPKRGMFSEWAIAAAARTKPRRRTSVQSSTCV